MATTCSDPVVLWGLFSAAYGGKLAEVKSLLKTNALAADVSDPNTGSTALQWASCGGSLEVVEWLVTEAGAEVAHRNKDDRTAFFFACEHCHKPVAEFLVDQRGVNVNEKDKPAGHSPLHRACIAGQTRDAKAAVAEGLVSWLLSEGDADANAADLAGRVPGEADLAREAPKLRPTPQAPGIRKMLEHARMGVAPGTVSSMAEKPMPEPEPVAARATATSTTASGRPTMTVNAARAKTSIKKPSVPAVAAGAVGGSVTFHDTVAPRLSSPSRVAERAAALASKTAPVLSAPTPAVVGSGVSSGTTPAFEAQAKAKAKASASPGLKAPSSSSPPRKAAENPDASSPPSSPPWNVKLRPGGVKPRSERGHPATASSVPAERGGRVRVTPSAALAEKKKTPVTKQYPYGQKKASGSSMPSSGNGPVAPSSAPLGRFPRQAAGIPTSDTVAPSNSATGASAAAVIGASHGPKASALAAAFENKARGRQHVSLSAAAPPVKSHAPSNGGVSAKPNGGGRVKSSAQSKASVEMVTPEELLGSGSVMQKTKIYVAAAKGNQGPAASKDNASAPLNATGKKGKDGSFMDKFVSMFTVSPQSSPPASPARSVSRSVSRSPRGSKPRSPMEANGAAANVTAASSPYENARMGFFNSNKSFKMDVGDKE